MAVRPLVLKVGGAVVRDALVLADVLASVALLAARRPVVVIPGGGEFADAVRAAQARLGFPDDTAHWMALLAMDQVAELLAASLPAGCVVQDSGEVERALGRGACPVLAPARWMRAADVLPHTWDVTSDSVAAFVAGALDAPELILVKRADGPLERLVDRAMASVAPVHLTVRAVTPAGLRALAGR
jgi:5-(aminomethyl)-3-furanmethanol phosphate kinase